MTRNNVLGAAAVAALLAATPVLAHDRDADDTPGMDTKADASVDTGKMDRDPASMGTGSSASTDTRDGARIEGSRSSAETKSGEPARAALGTDTSQSRQPGLDVSVDQNWQHWAALP